MLTRPVQNRREFLKQASLLTLWGLLPLSAGAGAGQRVVVVGGGLSGLYAARLLLGRGMDVQVLEGRERVGGRLFTLDDVPGRPEGGGNTIGPNYGRVISEASRLGVTLEVPPRGGGMGLLIDGQKVAREDWPDSPSNSLPEALRAVTPDRLRAAVLGSNPLRGSADWRNPDWAALDISAGEHFRAMGLDERSLRLLDVNNSYGNRLDDTSLLSLYRVDAAIRRAIAMRQPAFQVQGGNMRLPEAMAHDLGQRVLNGRVARRIEQATDQVRVSCDNGEAFEADAVICALPATAVRRLEFTPGLPNTQAEAFRTTVYHKVTQAHLVADAPWWEKSREPASWWTNGALGRVFARPVADGSGRQNLTVWITGDDCDRFDALDEAPAGEALLAQFLKQFPEAGGRVSLGRVVRWAVDPFNEGAWAVWRPGDIGRLPAAMQQPHGKVFFAGEHLAVSNSGMEGAMESGERAALDVLRRFA